MMPRRLIALLCALALPALAQTTFVTPATPGTPEVAQPCSLELARSGSEVMMTWTLPNMEIRQLELMRNTSSEAKGRGRAATVRAEPAMYIDQVPDLNVTYWYWLKITLANGQVINIGPVATPNGNVWTP